MSAVLCSLHRNKPAAWSCRSCGRDLCPLCAAPDPGQSDEALCGHCSAPADRRMATARAPANWRMIPAFFLSILSPRGLFFVAGLTVVVIAVGFVPMIGGLLSLGIFASYFFLVVRSAMQGRRELPSPTFENAVDDVFLPAVRFVLPSLMLLVPLALYIRHQILGAAYAEPMDLVLDPVLLLAGLGGVLVFPALLIVASVSSGVFSVFNPMHVVSLVLRVPGAYLVTVVLWLLIQLAQGLAMLGVGLLALVVQTPFLANVGVQLIYTAGGAFTALLFGWLIHANRERLGLDPLGDAAPAVPGAVPRGTLRGRRPPTASTGGVDAARGPGLASGPPTAGRAAPAPTDDDPRLWPGLPPATTAPSPTGAQRAPRPPEQAVPWTDDYPAPEPGPRPPEQPVPWTDDYPAPEAGPRQPVQPVPWTDDFPAPAPDRAPVGGPDGPDSMFVVPPGSSGWSGDPSPDPASKHQVPTPREEEGWLRPPSGDVDSLLADFIDGQAVLPDPDDD